MGDALESPLLDAEVPPPSQAASANDGSNLRQRRGLADDGDDRAKGRKKGRRRVRFRVKKRGKDDPTEAQEQVFLNMYIRKMKRRLSGKETNEILCCEFITVVGMMIAIIWLGWDESRWDESDGTEMEWHRIDTVGLVVLIFWIMFMFAAFFIVNDSPYVRMLRIMIVYIPLLYYIAELSFHAEMGGKKNASPFQILVPSNAWPMGVAIALEVLTFVSYMSYYKLVPIILKSKWFRNKPGRAAGFWNVGVMQDWTMCYRAHNPRHGATKCNLNYTCKYEGDRDPDTGLPDGLGRWLDDAWEGEMLTGYWKQGEPVAPFLSWNVGTDDAMVAVRVAYFKATDDVYTKNKFFPTNDQQPPECGVASVECSVSGSFYKHLPQATLIEGPYPVESMPTKKNNPIRETLSDLFQMGAEDFDGGGGGLTNINIRASDPRGVQVLGHVYAPTGRSFSSDTKSITVDVEWGGTAGVGGGRGGGGSVGDSQEDLLRSTARLSARFLQKTLFMPRAELVPLSRLVEIEIEDGTEEGQGDHEVAELDDQEWASPYADAESQEPKQSKTANLRIQNWIPSVYKEALIFFPGYNSCVEDSLKNFGQFLCMTKLSRHVYPFVFAWPGGQGPGYFYASRIAATVINHENVLKLLRGLKASGINRVHFMTHSMGVQTLLGALQDIYDENGKCKGRSDVSMCFQLDPDFDDTTGPVEGKRQQYSDKMLCKTITLLNPDFPLRAFVDRTFLSIRRICRTITVVGDRNDFALYWSSILNGIAPHFGYDIPEALRPTIAPFEHTKWTMERIGHSIEKLCFPAEVGRQYHRSDDKAFHRQLFRKPSPVGFSGQTENADEDKQFWLDVDVIDMTGLDTNIKGMRHSGFSLNGMLLKDLEELLSGGKRAMERSTLLYREGNIFSYAHAPAFVSQ